MQQEPRVRQAEAAFLLGAKVDVRTRAEWEWVGRVPNAVEIEWNSWPTGERNSNFLTQLRQQVDREARFVDDGDVVTSAGVSAGIDMALHLVARLDSVDAARGVRRGIQYDPRPPV